MTEPGTHKVELGTDTAQLVRLVLHEFLHQHQIADQFAGSALGKQALHAFSGECELGLRFAATTLRLTKSQRAEWNEVASRVCQHFFDQAEQRRSDIVRTRSG